MSQLVTRTTGKMIKQMGGYQAFVPDDLPPEPHIQYDDEMHDLLSRADRALGRLDGSIQSLPNPDLFVSMYVRKEAVLSSQIEGTQASFGDILEIEAQIFDPKRPKDTEEILNYISAMNYGLERLEELPMSLRLIREIHGRLMAGVRGQNATPGEFRTTQNWIGALGSRISDAIFVPPPPAALSAKLGQFETFMVATDRIPLLVRVALCHAQFETLHPFLDGNGRIGRLLITFTLCQKKILQKPVLYLSHYFKQHRSSYYDRLQSVRTCGDWEAWIKFFLRGIAEVSNEATETARKIVEMRQDHQQRLIESLGRGAANGLRFLDSLYQRPIFSVSGVSRHLNISSQAANNLINRILKLRIVTEITGQQRYRLFRYDPFIELFDDEIRELGHMRRTHREVS